MSKLFTYLTTRIILVHKGDWFTVTYADKRFWWRCVLWVCGIPKRIYRYFVPYRSKFQINFSPFTSPLLTPGRDYSQCANYDIRKIMLENSLNDCERKEPEA